MTKERAFSGSSVSVLVTKAMSRGRRWRAILWSADVLGPWSRSVRMQPAATLAVYKNFRITKLDDEGYTYHAIIQTVNDLVKETCD